MTEIEFVLSEDRDTYYVVKSTSGDQVELNSHWEALDKVKEFVKNGSSSEVYDETYDATFTIVDGLLYSLKLPIHLEELRKQYLETYYGMNHEEPLQPDTEEELVE